MRRNGLLEVIGVGLVHPVFVGRVVDDLLFLGGRHLTGIDPQGGAIMSRKSFIFAFSLAGGCVVLGMGSVLSFSAFRRKKAAFYGGWRNVCC